MKHVTQNDAQALPVLRDPDAPLAATVAALQRRLPVNRRRWLQALAAAAVVSPMKVWACSIIPAETAGPYPGDGTNGPNALTQTGILRSDLRSNFGASGTSVAAGTLTTVTLQLVNTNDNCAPLAGYAIYAWHCSATGLYSMYSAGAAAFNYLRGVQVTDAEGKVTFTTIFPGAYTGRWPHIHFEIYASAADATVGTKAVRITQLAMPESTCREVYAQSALYPGSLANLNQTPLARDNVFGDDGGVLQIPAVTGGVANGYALTHQVGISAAPSTAVTPDEGMWWASPAGSESGWGLNIAQQNGVLFLTWFTFDLEGKAWWLVARTERTGATTFAGTLYSGNGPPFNSVPFDPAQVGAAAVGSTTLTFADARNATFAYTVNGLAGTKPITLEIFGSGVPTCAWSAQASLAAATNFQDMWWATPAGSESGWGINLAHQGDTIFATWFTFGFDGKPLWLVFAAPKTGAGTYAGDVYTGTGPAFNAATFSPALVAKTKAGTAALVFADGNHAAFSYSIDGVSQTKSITREIFGGAGGTVCQA